MSADLHRLVYYSRNGLPGSPEQVMTAIRGILDASRANNSRVGVTGALMFNRDCFAQVLEGPRDAIEATFERIQQDERHASVMLLSFSPVPSRGFPNWSMAYVGANTEVEAPYADIARATGFDPSRMTGEAVYDVLTRQILDNDMIWHERRTGLVEARSTVP